MKPVTCINGNGRPVTLQLLELTDVKLCQECYDELIERWVKFLNHTLHKCSNEECIICKGDLQSCIVCGGAEITLPIECPGRWMTDSLMKKVQDRKIDFVNGGWEELNVKK